VNAIGDSVFDAGENARTVKQVIRTGSPRDGNFAGKRVRIHQPQIAQPHCFHGARCGADVARMRGV